MIGWMHAEPRVWKDLNTRWRDSVVVRSMHIQEFLFARARGRRGEILQSIPSDGRGKPGRGKELEIKRVKVRTEHHMASTGKARFPVHFSNTNTQIVYKYQVSF